MTVLRPGRVRPRPEPEELLTFVGEARFTNTSEVARAFGCSWRQARIALDLLLDAGTLCISDKLASRAYYRAPEQDAS